MKAQTLRSVVIWGILGVVVSAASARPRQELCVWPVVVRDGVSRLLGSFRGIVAEVEQLSCLSVENLDVELRVTQRTAAHIDAVRAVHILDGEGEHHQQSIHLILWVEPVFDLGCFVADAVARAAPDADGRVLVAAWSSVPANGQIILMYVGVSHSITTAGVCRVACDDGVGGCVSGTLYADGCRVVVRTTVLTLRIRVLCIAQRVEIQRSHRGCPRLISISLSYANDC